MDTHPLLSDVTGRGEPIVLVPGGLSGWASWIPHAQRLNATRMVVRVQVRSVELAEHGEPVPAGYGTIMEREALRATMDQLGLTHFDLAGWSYGAHIALAFALEYPNRVRTLTLIEPPASWILRATGHAATALDRDVAFDRSFANRAISETDLKNFLVRAGLVKPGDDVESLPGWPGWLRNRQALAINGTIHDYTDSLDRLRSLTVPILAVKGDRTAGSLASIVDDIAAIAPRARLLTLPGDHACHLQNADRFLTELESHLEGKMAIR